MKTIYLLLALLLPVFASTATAQKLTKEEKAAKLEKAFEETRALVESKQFQIDIDRVYPQRGGDVSRFNPRGEITVRDSTAKGNLPFFGRAYSLPFGDGGGIEFDAPMKDLTIKTIEKKKKKTISFNFTVTGKNDTYQLSIDVAPGGACSVNLTSNNRAQISYSGTLSALKEE